MTETVPDGPPRAIVEYWHTAALARTEGGHNIEWTTVAHVCATILAAMSPEPVTEYGQKYAGGGYLTRVDSDWMRERWPIEQWIWDNTRHGGVVGKRTIIVVDGWQDIRAASLPMERPTDNPKEPTA